MIQADVHQWNRFIDVFLAENKKLNLTALRTPEQCFIGNVLDSLALIDLLPSIIGKDWRQKQFTIADVGTGGGFPLLPLAMSLSNARCTGIDSTVKKIAAIQSIAQKMGTKNIELIAGRIEELARKPNLRGNFDIAIIRAVAPISADLEYTIPLLKHGGHAVLWKSRNIANEQKDAREAARKLRAQLIDEHVYELPEGFGERVLLVYRKTAATPDEYPRGVGIPKHKPL